MKQEMVVARYSEDIDWLKNIPKDIRIVIYNKGKKIDKSGYEILELPNYGRESNTYLTYIINRYNDLPDSVMFSQGLINDRKDQVSLELKSYFSPASSGTFLGALRICGDDYDWGNADLNSIANISEYQKSYGEFQEQILDLKFARYSLFVPGAYFSVGKSLILRRPRSYYEDLLQTELGRHINPRFGHFMERSWFQIFQNN